MASIEVGFGIENTPDPESDTRRGRVKEIMAFELSLCARVGMEITDFDAIATLNSKLHTEKLVDGRKTFEEEFPGLLDEVISPPDSEPKAEVVRLRKPQQTTPLPRHSSPE